jgi:hypothetical protein
MVLHLVVCNLREMPPVEDERPGSCWYPQGKEFIAWLREGNAAYRHVGDPRDLEALIANRDFAGIRERARAQIDWLAEHGMMSHEQARATVAALASDETLTGLLRGDAVEIFLVDPALRLDIYERPKDFAVARGWGQEHVAYEPEKQRFLDLLNLLESDDGLWLYESW